MCVGRYTPTNAVRGDMGWTPPTVRQYGAVARLWSKLWKMPDNRMTKGIFLENHKLACKGKQTWSKRVIDILGNDTLEPYKNNILVNATSVKHLVKNVMDYYMNVYVTNWEENLFNDRRRNPLSRNKLRVYRQFKTAYEPENYLTKYINPRHRRAFAQFRAGVAPIGIETGRYQNRHYIPVNERLCTLCDLNCVEDEIHVLCVCPIYENIRDDFYTKCINCYPEFETFSCEEKFIFAMREPAVCKISARTCFKVLLCRNDFIYHSPIT
jgi:hypothetical protein